MRSTWPTLSAFYTDDPRRARLHEVEIGSDWKADDSAAPWRAAWLPSTGEVFVVPASVQGESDPGPVEVLGVLPDRYTLDVGLRGWWHQCGHVGSLGWLRITIAALATPVR